MALDCEFAAPRWLSAGNRRPWLARRWQTTVDENNRKLTNPKARVHYEKNNPLHTQRRRGRLADVGRRRPRGRRGITPRFLRRVLERFTLRPEHRLRALPSAATCAQHETPL